MPRSVSQAEEGGKPDFDELATEILAKLERRSGKLLEYAGHNLALDDFGSLFAEREALVGILARAAFDRIHLKSAYTAILRDLRAIRKSPRRFVSNKEDYSAEAIALLDWQLLRRAKNKNTLAVFGLELKDAVPSKIPADKGAIPGTGPLGSISKAADSILRVLSEAYRRYRMAPDSVDPGLVAFLELPISQSNTAFARALRGWLQGEKPTRITQHGNTRSSVDAFLEIILPAANEVIEKHHGRAYSHDGLIAEMSKRPKRKRSS